MTATAVRTLRLTTAPKIAADINGSAIVTWTPEQAGTHTLTVRSLFADGMASPERTFTFLVADAPEAESGR